jgi:hypothetical protein
MIILIIIRRVAAAMLEVHVGSVPSAARLGKMGDPMGVWGLILSALGAVIVAWAQSDIARSVALWLTALELEKDSSNSRRDIYNVVGPDKHMKRSLKLNRWLAPIGWVIFIVGILMQTVPYFRQHGWAALSLS